MVAILAVTRGRSAGNIVDCSGYLRGRRAEQESFDERWVIYALRIKIDFTADHSAPNLGFPPDLFPWGAQFDYLV
jgi:hypothetical protein